MWWNSRDKELNAVNEILEFLCNAEVNREVDVLVVTAPWYTKPATVRSLSSLYKRAYENVAKRKRLSKEKPMSEKKIDLKKLVDKGLCECSLSTMEGLIKEVREKKECETYSRCAFEFRVDVVNAYGSRGGFINISTKDHPKIGGCWGVGDIDILIETLTCAKNTVRRNRNA